MSLKKTNVTITVHLDENRIPEQITWSAEENGKSEKAQAMFVSFWNEAESSTVKLDLLTKEMPVSSMQKFLLQNLDLLGKYYYRATGDEKVTTQLADLVEHLKADFLEGEG